MEKQSISFDAKLCFSWQLFLTFWRHQPLRHKKLWFSEVSHAIFFCVPKKIMAHKKSARHWEFQMDTVILNCHYFTQNSSHALHKTYSSIHFCSLLSSVFFKFISFLLFLSLSLSFSLFLSISVSRFLHTSKCGVQYSAIYYANILPIHKDNKEICSLHE